jgi:Tfp pilus assembly protein PilZ
MPQSEHRKQPRVRISGLEALTGKAVLQDHELLALNRSSLCVQVCQRERPGVVVELQITFLESDETVAVTGKVVWVTDIPPLRVGIQLVDVDLAAATVLARYLDPE